MVRRRNLELNGLDTFLDDSVELLLSDHDFILHLNELCTLVFKLHLKTLGFAHEHVLVASAAHLFCAQW